MLGVTSGQELLGTMVSRLQKPIWLKALRDSGVPEAEAQAICERIAAEYVPWQESSFPGLLGNVVAGRIANRFDLGGTNCVVDAACASSLSAIHLASMELATGRADYVLTGGEVPALAVIDAVVRLMPGVLGDAESVVSESFAPANEGLLEYPQYTRPAEFEGMSVPDVLVSGDHAKIAEWRREQARRGTEKRRPDLI